MPGFTSNLQSSQAAANVLLGQIALYIGTSDLLQYTSFFFNNLTGTNDQALFAGLTNDACAAFVFFNFIDESKLHR